MMTGAGISPPLRIGPDLPGQVDGLLHKIVNPRATGLIHAIQRASRYANITGDGAELRMSRRVIALGILEDGLAEPSAHRSSAWLTSWAARFTPGLDLILGKLDRGPQVSEALASRPHIALTPTVPPVLERAREIARLTVHRDVIDLRHFLFALSEDPGRAFADFPRAPSVADIDELRRFIVANIERGPEPGERIDAWQRLLEEPFEPGAREVVDWAPDTKIRIEEGIETGGDAGTGVVARRKAGSVRGRRTGQGRTDGDQDFYRTQTDDPAKRDVLDREPFARVLSERLRLLRAPGDEAEPGAFMLHIHGRWGSGKSSVLNFLKEKLEQEEGPGRAARVIVFNAWEHNSRKPPWWPFLSKIYLTVLADKKRPLGWRRRWKLRAYWWWWRLRADVVPIAIIVAVFLIAIFEIGRDGTSVDTAVKIVGAIVTASAAIYAYGRSLMFGSQRAAQTYSDLKADPLARVVTLFDNIIDAIGDDVVVIIDDLDRCDADFVVDLLEGIQNLFKGKAVTYVAAADRKWICTAFEKRYADFAARIAEPARPLGYLFLEKMFQISAGMPRLTPELQDRYLGTLTNRDQPIPVVSEQARSEAKAALDKAHTEAQIQAVVKKLAKTPEAARAVREEAAIKITTPPLKAQTEDRLKPLRRLMEPNPRAMKRLVNEVAMAQARGILEGRSVAAEARARWAMIMLRWPQFAEYIADDPNIILKWKPARKGGAPRGPFGREALPEAVRSLTTSKILAGTIGAAGDVGALDRKIIAELLR